jgi:hypothetical protein
MSGSKSFDVAHDFPEMSQPSSKPILTFDKQNPVRFTDLIDTINSYAGFGGYFLMVSLTENGITVSPVVVESDKNYIHTQAIASNSWTVNHNLDKFPSVTVVDSNDRKMTGSVQYIDVDNVTISFEFALTGKVYCN